MQASHNNLPLQLGSFIGRERELAEVERLLSTARLVTLTGAGEDLTVIGGDRDQPPVVVKDRLGGHGGDSYDLEAPALFAAPTFTSRLLKETRNTPH